MYGQNGTKTFTKQWRLISHQLTIMQYSSSPQPTIPKHLLDCRSSINKGFVHIEKKLRPIVGNYNLTAHTLVDHV